MARPPAEIRTEIERTLRARGPLALRDLVETVPLQATPRVIEATVENMCRAGVVVAVGREKRPHCRKWVSLYDLAQPIEHRAGEGWVDLGRIVAGWAR